MSGLQALNGGSLARRNARCRFADENAAMRLCAIRDDRCATATLIGADAGAATEGGP